MLRLPRHGDPGAAPHGPFAGNAISVTAVLLAVYLAALAGGYPLGGGLARCGDPRPLLAFGLPVSEMVQVAVYSVLGIALVRWLLAECVLLASAFMPGADHSRTTGGVFALSTVGNFGGSLLTTFVLLPHLSIASATIVLVAALCLALVVAHGRSVPALALLAFAAWPALNLWVEGT